MLFNVITADIAEIKENKASEIMEIGSESKEEFQKSLENLAKWGDRNYLEINIEKNSVDDF